MATVKQIAERAGVSIGTVSNVLNGLPSVRESARQRVLKAMKQLEYQPSLLGRALRKDKTNMIVMIVPDITNPFFPGAVRGAEDVAFKHGFRLVLCNSDNDLEKEATYLDEMRTYRPSGLIIVPADLSKGTDEAKAYLRGGCSVVYMDRIPSNWRGDSVTSAHEEGAYLATRHLIELGHRRIATITGPLTLSSATARLAGYRRAIEEAGFAAAGEYVQEADFNTTAGLDAARKLLALKSRPTAIFAANDLIGFGVLAAAREAGLHCPEEISVVGFDNLDESEVATPRLSTVEQFAYEVGARAAEIVIERNQGNGGPAKHIVLAPKLLVKDSSGPPAKRGRSARGETGGRRKLAAAR